MARNLYEKHFLRRVRTDQFAAAYGVPCVEEYVFTRPGAGTQIADFHIPRGAIVSVDVAVVTEFNGSSNVLKVGDYTLAEVEINDEEFVPEQDLTTATGDLGTGDFYPNATAPANRKYYAESALLRMSLVNAGAGTTGEVRVRVKYEVPSVVVEV